MVEAASPEPAKAGYTSESTRRLNDLAASVLAGDSTEDEVLQQIERISECIGELGDEERRQLEELTRLLNMDAGQSDLLDKLSSDAAITIHISHDGMTASLSIRPATGRGKVAEHRHVIALLDRKGVNRGVDHEAIAMAVKRSQEGDVISDEVIARGCEPVAGEPPRVSLHVRANSGCDPVTIDPDAVTDDAVYADKAKDNWVCDAGDTVLTILAAGAGEPGFTVTGQEIPPPPPEPVSIHAGPNVTQDDNHFVAAVGGLVLFDGHTVEVRQMLVLDGDRSGKDGPIDFDGDVTVRGNLRSGAHVKATGHIAIEGSVEAASVESTGGDVYLRHGVAGQHEATIRAANDIYSRFVENATLIAGNDITVDIGALHSRLIAGRAVHVVRGRGQVIGGTVMAADLIEAKQVGATSGVRSQLHVGLSRQIMEKVGRIDEQIARLRVKREGAAEVADKMARAVGDPAELTDDERATYTRLRQVQLVCDVQVRQLNRQHDEVLAEGARQTHGRVEVSGALMPKVTVRIGDAELDNDEVRRGCRISYDEAQQQLRIDGVR